MSSEKRCRLTEKMLVLVTVFAAVVMLVIYSGTARAAAEDCYGDIPIMESGKAYTVVVPSYEDVNYRIKEKRTYETSTDWYCYNYKFTINYVSGNGVVTVKHGFSDGSTTGSLFDEICKSNPSGEITADFVGAYDDKDDILEFFNDSGSTVTVTLRIERYLADHLSLTPAGPAAPSVGTTAAVSGGTVKVISGNTAEFIKAQNKKSVTVPATAVIGGKSYAVTQIGAKAFTGKKIKTVTVGANINKIAANAFKGSKATKMILKTKLLKKGSVRKSLKGSKLKSIKVKVGSKKVNKQFVKKYKKIFKKGNSGKKVSVK